MPDEPTQEQPRRRRPVLLAMLAAAALLVALAGTGVGSGGSANGGTNRVTQGAPAADDPAQGQGFTHRGRHCHHDNQQQQQQPSGQPPV